MFNEREASSRSACWFQRGRSVVVQRRAPGALRGSSSPVPGDQSGRPGDGRLPFGALRRAMPAVHASVQKRRWRRALPAVTQTYTELPASWPTLFWGSLSQDPLSAAPARRRQGVPCAAQRRLRRGRAAWLGGVAPSAGRVRRPYTHVLTHNQKSRAASAIEPPMQSRVDVASIHRKLQLTHACATTRGRPGTSSEPDSEDDQ